MWSRPAGGPARTPGRAFRASPRNGRACHSGWPRIWLCWSGVRFKSRSEHAIWLGFGLRGGTARPRGKRSRGHHIGADATQRDPQDKQNENKQNCFATALIIVHSSSQPGTAALLRCSPGPRAAAENRWHLVRCESMCPAKRFGAEQTPQGKPKERAKPPRRSKTDAKPGIQAEPRRPRATSPAHSS